MQNFPEIIKDGSIELRRIKPTFALAEEVLKIINRNREHLGRWLPWVACTHTIEDEYNSMMILREKEWSYWIFMNGKICGSISFVHCNEKRKKLEIGYWLDNEFAGQGIMTRAVGMLEKVAFEMNDWIKIEIHCSSENIPSQNIPKRAGYHLDGVLRQDFPYPDGRVDDTMVWSKLKSEFAK